MSTNLPSNKDFNSGLSRATQTSRHKTPKATKTPQLKNRFITALLIDSYLLKTNFPWLARFTEQVIRDKYIKIGYAPEEILVPREFFFNSYLDDCPVNPIKISRHNTDNSIQKKRCLRYPEVGVTGCNPEKVELVHRVCRAFRRNKVTFYQQYSYVWRVYRERSLYNLPITDLKKVLLEVVNNTIDLTIAY